MVLLLNDDKMNTLKFVANPNYPIPWEELKEAIVEHTDRPAIDGRTITGTIYLGSTTHDGTCKYRIDEERQLTVANHGIPIEFEKPEHERREIFRMVESLQENLSSRIQKDFQRQYQESKKGPKPFFGLREKIALGLMGTILAGTFMAKTIYDCNNPAPLPRTEKQIIYVPSVDLQENQVYFYEGRQLKLTETNSWPVFEYYRLE